MLQKERIFPENTSLMWPECVANVAKCGYKLFQNRNKQKEYSGEYISWF